MFVLVKFVVTLIVTANVVGGIELFDASDNICMEDTTTCEDIASPYQIQIIKVVDSTLITWTLPQISGECSAEFELAFYMNDELLKIDTTKTKYYILNEELNSCSKFRVEIRTVTYSGSKSALAIEEIHTAFAEVSNVNVNNGVASWSIKEDSTRCMFRLELNGQIVADNLKELFYNVGCLIPCETHEIAITPINSDEALGTPYTIRYEPGIPSPYNIQIIQFDSSIVITWAQLQIAKNCTTGYELSFYINDVFVMSDTTELARYIFKEGLTSCSRLRIEIKAVSSSGFESDVVSAEIDTEMDKISKLTIENDVISWSMAGGPTRCKFLIELNQEIVAHNVNGLSYRLENLTQCISNEITVTPINFNGNIGISHSLQHEPVPTVKNFKLIEDNDILVASWDHLSKYCTVVIAIGEQKHIVQDSSDGLLIIDPADFTHCVSYLVTVMYESVSGKSGEETSVAFSRVPTTIKNFYVTQEPNTEIIKASWDALNGECTIMISILDTNYKIIVSAGEGLLILDDDQFENCTTHTLQAEIVSPTGCTGNVVSYDFERRPPAMQNVHVIEDREIDEITVKWDPLVGNCITSIAISDSTFHVEAAAGSLHIPSDNFNYCTAYNLYAQFMSSSGIRGSPEVVTFERYPPKMEDLEVSEDAQSGEITVRWPTSEHACTVRVTVSEEEVARVASANNVLLEGLFEYCTEYKVEAHYVGVTNEIWGTAYTFFFEKYPPKMEGLNVIEDVESGAITAVWPISEYDCTVRVIVSGEEVASGVTTNSVALEDIFQYCTDYIVEAYYVAVTNGKWGTADTFQFERYPPKMKNLNVVEDVESGAITAVWPISEYDCTVRVIVSGEEIANGVPTNSVALEDNFQYCTDYTVEAQYVAVTNGKWGTADTFQFERYPPKMENLKVIEDTESGKITAEWPISEYACTVRVTISGDEVANGVLTNSVPLEDSLEYCTDYKVEAHYMAVTNGKWGTADTFQFERYPPIMKNLKVTENVEVGEITASWSNLGLECIVRVTVFNWEVVSGVSADSVLLDNPFEYCTHYEVEAHYVAVTSNNYGTADIFHFERKPPKLENFQVTENVETGEITASWLNSGLECTVRVTVFDEEVASDVSADSVLLEHPFEYCTDYEVEAHYVGVTSNNYGTGDTVHFEKNPPKMEGLEVSEGAETGEITAKWSSSTHECTVRVTVADVVVASDVSENSVLLEGPFDYCTDYKVEAHYVGITDKWGDADTFVFQRSFQPISAMSISVINQIVGASLLLIDTDDMKQCEFDGSFNFNCGSLGVLDGSVTREALEILLICPLDEGVDTFTMEVTPYLGTSQFKVQTVTCEYDVIRDGSIIYLIRRLNFHNVCPQSSTLL